MRLGAYASTPGCGRPDRPRNETAAAVRANIMKLVVDAVRAERALIAADARFRRIGREIPVAIFAIGSKLQRHGDLTLRRRGSSQIKRLMRRTNCLLYTSDAADDLLCVDLGGR